MPSFGEKLKLEREKRKISLDQISSSTKIGTRMLQALEEEKFSQLPGGIFNKGFVRAYARVVGLDEDQTVADYLQASGEGPTPKSDPAMRDAPSRDTVAREEGDRISRLEAISDEPSRPLPWGLFAVILLAIALLLSLWSHRRREQERQDARPAPAKTTGQSRGAAAPESTTLSAGGPAISTSTSTPSSSSSQPPASSLLTSTAVNSPIPNQAAAQVAAPAVQSSSTAPSPGEFLVLIHAREESWVSVTVDGKLSGSELLEPGSERVFHAHKDVAVKAGNAGGLDFQLDGKKLDVGGEFGEVKSVTIGHAGLIPNPAPLPTNL